MTRYALIPFILTGLALIPILGLAVYLIIHSNKKQKEETRMSDMITEALDYENSDESTKKKSPLARFFEKYINNLRGAGLVNPTMSNKDIITRGAIIALVVYMLALVLSGFNIFIGIFPVFILFAGIYIYANSKVNAINRMMEEQIPSFLSTLKSNIQSNQTPERALVSAIDNTADPLYSELEIVKSLIETGTFETAMATLRVKTKSKTLKFLCSCIELSTEVGANLEEQIVVIEHMINARKELDRKMDSAVAENRPLMWAGLLAVPFLFLYMYFMNSQTRSFWFHAPISWLLLIIVIFLLLFGLWAGNKVINKVRNM